MNAESNGSQGRRRADWLADAHQRAGTKVPVGLTVGQLLAYWGQEHGIERHDVDYILDTFPIVQRKDEVTHGEDRTKRLILERYDAMADAEAAGRPYQTALDPPPAHPSLAHAESTRPDWARPVEGP